MTETGRFFSEALFDRSLKRSDSFVSAFDMAKTVIAGWEKEQKITASDPQISIGENIKSLLPPLTR